MKKSFVSNLSSDMCQNERVRKIWWIKFDWLWTGPEKFRFPEKKKKKRQSHFLTFFRYFWREQPLEIIFSHESHKLHYERVNIDVTRRQA